MRTLLAILALLVVLGLGALIAAWIFFAPTPVSGPGFDLRPDPSVPTESPSPAATPVTPAAPPTDAPSAPPEAAPAAGSPAAPGASTPEVEPEGWGDYDPTQHGQVVGRVLDPQGGPVAGATVSLEHKTKGPRGIDSTFYDAREIFPSGWTEVVFSAMTDDQGAFALHGTPGDAIVRASHEAWQDETARVTLVVGEKIDIVLEVAAGLELAGRVVDSKGVGVPGAQVSAYHTGVSETSARTAESDAQGAFLVRGLEPETYQVSATADGFLADDVSHSAQAGRAEPVVITLVSGRKITGVVHDPEGAPVIGANVQWWTHGEGTGAGDGFNAYEACDDKGRFVLTVRPELAGKISASAVGFAPSATLDVPAGRDEQDLVLVLSAGLAQSGRVVDAQGLGIAGAHVQAFEVGEGNGWEMGRGNSMPHNVMATTNDEGAFVLKGVREGIYAINAVSEGYVQSDQMPAPIKLPTQSLTLTLTAAAKIKGVVKDEAGQPVAAADVEATPAGDDSTSAAGAFGQVSFSTQSAQSGEDGTFELNGLSEGAYKITAKKQGMLGSDPQEVTLAAGQTGPELVLVLRVGGTIRGSVVDDLQSPVPGAHVSAQPTESMWGPWSGQNTTADEGGTFAITGIGDGTYFVNASAVGHEDTGGWDMTAERKTARAGDTVVITLPRAASVTGRVVDGAGKPVGEFTVSVFVEAPGMGGTYAATNESIADASGTFTLATVSTKARQLGVHSAAHVMTRVDLPKLEPGARHDAGIITLSDGAYIAGIVVDPKGKPVAGAVVTSRGDEQDASGAAFWDRTGQSTATTAADGTFKLEHLPEGRTTVHASHDKLASARAVVDVPAEGGKDDVRIELGAGSAVFGTARDGTGKPRAGAMIMAMPQDGFAGGFSPEEMKQATVDAEGNYRLEGLAAGAYMVMLQLIGEASQQQRIQNVRLSSGADLRVDFIDGTLCRFSGRLINFTPAADATMTPMSRMINLFSRSSDAMSQVTAQLDDEGRFAFEPVPSGSYQLMVMGSLAFAVDLPPEAEYSRDFELPRSGITGTVVDGEGAPAASCQVQATRRGDGDRLGRTAWTMTDAQGRFTLGSLPPATYDLVATRQDLGTTGSVPVEVPEGATLASVELRIAPAQTLTVTVRGANGDPLPSATLLLLDELGNLAGGNDSFGSTGPDGRAEFRNVPAGRIRIYAGGGTLPTSWKDVTISEGGNSAELVVPASAGSLAVRVLRDGQAVPGADLQLRDSQGQALPDLSLGLTAIFTGATTGPDGTHATGPFPAGAYALRIRSGEDTTDVNVSIPRDGGITNIDIDLAR